MTVTLALHTDYAAGKLKAVLNKWDIRYVFRNMRKQLIQIFIVVLGLIGNYLHTDIIVNKIYYMILFVNLKQFPVNLLTR